jgi:phage terminase large subunit
MTNVIIPYTPREAFRPYHAATERFGVTVAHRRAGKTVARINKQIRAAARCVLPEPKYAYLAPYYVQSKDIAWAYLKRYAQPLIAMGGKAHESDLCVTLPGNRATIRLYGAENIERMRGSYFDGVCIDEAQDIPASVLSSVILPTLADRGGWLDVSGTPKGWGNLLGQTYKQSLTDPTWFHQMLKASQTGIIPDAELHLMRAHMPDNTYQQEFECSFDAAISGAYLTPGIIAAEKEGRIAAVPYDRAAKVHTSWDLGVADSTVIWFFQTVGREVRYIDCYKASGEGLDHYARVLQEKGYLYGTHYAPHDIAVREFGSGRSRIETASMLGIEFTPVPNMPVKDGIDAARMVLSRCWFDKAKCAEGLDALRQYRERVDKKGVAHGPLHDWTSHYADAFRYGVIAYDEPGIAQRAEELDRFGGGGHNGGWMG